MISGSISCTETACTTPIISSSPGLKLPNFAKNQYIQATHPPHLAKLVQRHTPCKTLRSASANLLYVTRRNISFGARGFRSAAPATWYSLPSNVRSCKTLTTFHRHFNFIFSFNLCRCLATHLSASDSLMTTMLY